MQTHAASCADDPPSATHSQMSAHRRAVSPAVLSAGIGSPSDRRLWLLGLKARYLFLGIVLLAQLGTLNVASAETSSQVAYTTTSLRIHVSPALGSPTVFTIPSGSKVTLVGCDSGWCQVRFHGRLGYVVERVLTKQAPQRIIYTGHGYTNSQGQRVPSPAQTSDGQAPPGATAQCCDGTFSFSVSRRGTCSHHGGVCRWLR